MADKRQQAPKGVVQKIKDRVRSEREIQKTLNAKDGQGRLYPGPY